MATAIFYASSTGNTENAANLINEQLGGELNLINIADEGISSMADYDKVIIGASTWGEGELQDDWEEAWDEFKGIDFSSKTVALFGLGDQEDYAEYYLDAMGMIYDVVTEKGATVVGSWPIDEYEHEESKAIRDDQFVGLALDEDNQYGMTKDRITTWCGEIKGQIV